MSQPLTGQRPRAEVIAELYDRHAAGLFAYCADQLGDLGSASDVLASVLAAVPDTTPPRAALYAFARREIDLIRLVREGHSESVPTTPVAVMTGECDASMVLVLRELHVSRVLLKPFKVKAILETITQIFESSPLPR